MAGDGVGPRRASHKKRKVDEIVSAAVGNGVSVWVQSQTTDDADVLRRRDAAKTNLDRIVARVADEAVRKSLETVIDEFVRYTDEFTRMCVEIRLLNQRSG